MPPDDTRPLPTEPAAFPAERELVITRRFTHPPPELFRAWTEPERLIRWWAPPGFTVPVAKIDLRPGGACRLVMRDADGTDYPFKGIYQEILPPQRLIIRVTLHDHPGEWHEILGAYRSDDERRTTPGMLWLVTFDARDEGTALSFHARFDSRTERHAMLKAGMPEKWTHRLDRLAVALAAPPE